MVNSPESNPVLTPEQTLAIETTKQRLTILEAEITSANKTLTALKNETIVAVRSKEYYDQQLEEVKSLLSSKQSELEKVNADCLEMSAKLTTAQKEVGEKLNELNTKEISLKTREDVISQREKALSERDGNLSLSEAEHNGEKEDFYSKVESLKQILSQF